MRLTLPILTAAIALALLAAPGQARDLPRPSTPALAVPAHGVIGVQDEYLTPDFWIGRLQQPDAVIFDRAAIEAHNARLVRVDDSLHDLAALPATLDRARVAQWIEGLSRRPTRTLYGEDHQPVAAAALDEVVANAALDAIPATQATRYGLTVRRAALRTFPTTLRVFNSDDDSDIDRFQESALFPGAPVAIVHGSRDGKWLFVVSPRYAAWVERDAIAEGARDAVLGYPAKAPYRVVTGPKLRTVYTPEAPRVSELQLDMGVRVPLADVPPDRRINGQHPYAAWTVELPVRNADGSLAFSPALLQKNADTAADALPLTRANILRQAFKFLGERYGWGHSYNGRDCSGFVSEVYSSMGVLLPRNTSDQAFSPGLDHVRFTEKDGRAAREAAARALQVGDLVYIPGHVMMVIGHVGDVPYVIHDTNGGSYLGADGKLRSMGLNGVSVTPLTPLRFNARDRYIDRMTSIVRIRPTANQEGSAP